MEPDLIAGRYHAQRPIGRGGMGTVWLCRDSVLDRDVAVKRVGRLPGESTTDSARAMREARSSAALNHRNVVSVFDVVEVDDSILMVMEYVPSRTLAELLAESGPLSPEHAARIGAQVADGLAAAHSAGTVHRDVKPGNILVGDDGVAKISDFGIARTTGDATLTQTGMLIGSPAYFSPELARGAESAPSSDVWALGATLYAAVEGRPPYPEQPNALALLQKIATERPPRPRNAGILEPALDRMMDRDPKSRWAMADAAHSLHRLADPKPRARAVPVATPEPEPGDGTAEPEQRRRVPALLPWLLAAAVLAAVVVLGVLLLTRAGSESGSAASDRPTHSPSPSGAPSQSPSPSPSASRSPSPSPTHPSARTHPASRTQRISRFVAGYYNLMPSNTDAGWSELAPSEQSVGRSSYERFWGSIDSVSASHIVPDPRSPTVDLTLTYHFSDGRVVVERQRLLLNRAGGRYLIARDDVLSSRTVHG